MTLAGTYRKGIIGGRFVWDHPKTKNQRLKHNISNQTLEET